jgi:hypothetical protein
MGRGRGGGEEEAKTIKRFIENKGDKWVRSVIFKN